MRYESATQFPNPKLVRGSKETNLQEAKIGKKKPPSLEGG
jgi:hypothetical protein